MNKETRMPFAYVAASLIPTGAGFAIGGVLLDQPAFVYSGLGLLIPGLVLAVTYFWVRRRA